MPMEKSWCDSGRALLLFPTTHNTHIQDDKKMDFYSPHIYEVNSIENVCVIIFGMMNMIKKNTGSIALKFFELTQ